MSDGSRKPEDILKLLEKAEKDQQGLPPVHNWEPERQLDIDMRIARDGTWYYQESPIRRHRMVKLFSTILRRDGDDYFLVTPVEKLGIRVDDAPFVATELERLEEGGRKLLFTTNVDATVLAGPEHPIDVQTDPDTGEPSPYVLVRNNLWALISRNVFYRLVELAEEEQRDGERWLVVESDGETFPIGRVPEAG